MKTKFKYKPKNIDKVKEGRSRYVTKFDRLLKEEYEVFVPKEGTNKIRILPASEDYWGIRIVTHRLGEKGFPYACPAEMKKEPCPVCEERAKAKRDGDDEYAKALAPSYRLLLWIIDRERESDGPLLYDMSRTLEIDLNSNALDEDTQEILPLDDPIDGYDFRFQREGKGLTTKYSGLAVARKSSPLADDAETIERWIEFIQENPLENTVNIYSYEHLKGLLTGQVESPEVSKSKSEEEEEESPAPVTSKNKDDDEEADAPWEEEEDEDPKKASDNEDRFAGLRSRLQKRLNK